MKMIRALLAAMISSALPYLLYGDYNASESLDQAKMYLETDEIQAGEAILLRIVSSDSPLPEASFLLGQLYFNKNNWEESLKHLSNAVASEDNFKAHLVLAKVWLAGFKNISMAQTHVDNANAISPNNERVHCTQALIFLYQGQDFRAQEYFEFAEEINPHIDRLSIAKVLLHFKHVNLAEKWLEKAHIEQCVPVKKSSVCVEILLLLAESREHRGDTYSPKRLYTEALKLEPRNPVAHTALALLLLGTGVYNYGAPEACGMNQEDAINHLAVAWQNSNPHKQKAISALQFCIKELHEVEIWHRHAAPLIVKTPLLRMFRFVGLNSSIVSIIMSPLIALIRLSEFFFQSMFGLTTPTFKPLVSAHLSSPSPADNMRRVCAFNSIYLFYLPTITILTAFLLFNRSNGSGALRE